MDTVIKKLEQWLQPKLQEKGLFSVEIKILPGNKVQVFIDGMQGVTIAQCAEISRYLERMLDTEKILGEKYILEVSSPGLDNPFRVLKQYQKNIGREVEVLFLNGIKKFGTLLQADENKIILEESRNKERIQSEIELNQIKNTKIKLKF